MKTICTSLLLLLIINGNLIEVLAQNDIKVLSRIDGKLLNITHQKPEMSRLHEAVLFIHGASFPSALASGFRMNGISWQDNLVKAGYDVFALDFLGYGKSDRYNYMSDKGDAFAESSGGKDVIEDVDIVVDYIRRTLPIEKVHLIGHSWGGTVSGHYATMYPEKIDKLILFAPFVQRGGYTTWSKPTAFYIDLTPEERVKQFLNRIPEGEQVTLEEEILTEWKEAWLKSDLTSTSRNPHSIRFPSAWEKDLHDCWNGECFFDASKIRNPTLLIRGEWDTTLNGEEADKTFMEIKSASFKKYVVIEKGTHVMHLEKSRFELYEESLAFLKTNVAMKKNEHYTIAVIFEVIPKNDLKNEYLDIALSLKPELEKIKGFISIERFQSIYDPTKILSLSFWESEEAIEEWRNLEAHRTAQAQGREYIFKDYRLRVAQVIRDYGKFDRKEAPADSKSYLK